jgi:hypothetical protein
MSPARWRIGLQADPITVHTWFPLAALTLLEQAGEVELEFLSRSLPAERSLWVEVEDREAALRAAVSIDLVDAGELAAPRRAASADVTFKRSFTPGGYPGSARVAPYGLQLACRAGGERFAAYARQSRAVRSLVGGWRTRPPLLREYEARPRRDTQPRVVFQVRAWNPADGRDPEDRRARNEERATLIRVLRQHLGDAFVGGFVDTPYARAAFADCVISGPGDFRSYLHLIQRCHIGVSTAGLRDSNPYKLAEYLAGGHAIVSSPLHHELPDGPLPMRAFSTVAEAVDACTALLDDPAPMQDASAAAWSAFHRPDVLMRHRLDELPGLLAA